MQWLRLHFPGSIQCADNDPISCLRFIELDTQWKGRITSAVAACHRFRGAAAEGKLWTPSGSYPQTASDHY